MSGVHPMRPVPRQERSRRTEQALLDAALALFRERGVDAVTVADVATVAGVSPGSIYRRFGDKEGLLREAFARFVDSTAAMLEALPPPPRSLGVVALAAEITAQVVLFANANQRLLQSSYAKALSDAFYAERLVALRGRILERLRTQLRAHVDRIGHPEPEVAIDFALRQATAMLSARVEASRLEVGSSAMSDRVFLRELLRSLLAYLEVPATATAIDRALSARGL